MKVIGVLSIGDGTYSGINCLGGLISIYDCCRAPLKVSLRMPHIGVPNLKHK